MIVHLNEHLKYKIVKHNDHIDYDADFLYHLDYAYNCGDKLSANYNITAINRMIEYGYIFHEDTKNLVFMVGLEDFGKKIGRSFSRLFIHHSKRNFYWKMTEVYQLVVNQIERNKEHLDFVFASREAANVGTWRIFKKQSEYFSDWIINAESIELKYKNNFQFIFYKSFSGSVEDHVSHITFKET